MNATGLPNKETDMKSRPLTLTKLQQAKALDTLTKALKLLCEDVVKDKGLLGAHFRCLALKKRLAGHRLVTGTVRIYLSTERRSKRSRRLVP
jgi:hypothetical protein